MNRATRSIQLLLLLAWATTASPEARGEPQFDEALGATRSAWSEPAREPVPDSFITPNPAREDARPTSPTHATDSGEPGPHQFRTPGAPAAPTEFNPDSGVKPGTLRPEVDARPGLERRRQVIRSAPRAPEAFNPDPGAHLKPPVTNPPPFFESEVPAAAEFSGAPVPKGLALPRPNVRRDALVVTNPPTTGYGKEPLPSGLELPRENARGVEYIPGHWHNPHYPHVNNGYTYPPNSEPVTNRWRIGFAPWKRYTSASVEQPYETPQPLLWRPYRQSVLKGDAPIIGQDIFLNLTAESTTEFEARRVPVPSGVSAAQFSGSEFYGRSESYGFAETFAFSMELFKGETVFQPVHWALKLKPVVNYNFAYFNEAGIVNPDPRGPGAGNGGGSGGGGIDAPGDVGGVIDPDLDRTGDLSGDNHTTRHDYHIALQEAFVELHLGDLSENYDFFAVKLGNQPFISDFRGFIFNDVNLGARLSGNWDNNRWQYNLAGFDMNEKDTNSELNKFARRDQRVIIANLYKQDFIWKGYTVQASVHANLDEGETHYDENGVLTRPEPLGTVREHDVNAYYLGFAGDGHIGRWNVSHAFYQVLGRDDFNGLAGRPVDINAQMAALEVSYDRDWMRYKMSLFYASGDGDPTDGKGNGFDTILDNPNFTGGPFSWYVRQGFNLGGTGVSLKPRGTLVPSMRSSKTEGQANFVNPGVFIVGLGTEMDLTPKLRAFVNANYIRLMETQPIKTALLTDQVDNELGWDLSVGIQYRPALTDNIIISTGFGVLIPGAGYKDIYKTGTTPVPGYSTAGAGVVDDFLYSAIVAVTLTY